MPSVWLNVRCGCIACVWPCGVPALLWRLPSMAGERPTVCRCDNGPCLQAYDRHGQVVARSTDENTGGVGNFAIGFRVCGSAPTEAWQAYKNTAGVVESGASR